VKLGPAGIVHVVESAKASENRLTEKPYKPVATVLPKTGIRAHIPGNLCQYDRIISFPVGKLPNIGGDLGSKDLKLEPTVKIQPQTLASPSRIGKAVSTPKIRLYRYEFYSRLMIPYRRIGSVFGKK
jgi:hypothetical protein